MSDVWTAPTNVATGEADIDLYNAHVLANLRYLDQRDRARGIIAHQRETAASASTAVSADTDMLLNDVPVESGRAYLIWLNASYVIFGSGSWTVNLHIDGTQVHRMDYDANSGNQHVSNAFLYYASSTTTIDIKIAVAEITGTASFLFDATYDNPRDLWVEDIGPQP